MAAALSVNSSLRTASSKKEGEEEAHHPHSPPEFVELYETWRYPVGQSRTAILLYMNHYVSREQVHIPCEIALVAFSVQSGIRGSFWTLVDPISIPLGHGVEAVNNAEKFAVPHPPFTSNCFRNYRDIVDNIERFIETYRNDQQDGATSPSIICSRKHLISNEASFKWLYQKANKSFPHRIGSLERLLIALSLGGLDSLVRQSNFRQTLPDTVSLHTRIYSKPDASDRQSEVASIIASSYGSTSSYHTIGKATRQASLHPGRYPFAMLGAFLFESQAEEYMAISAYLEREELACNYHQEEMIVTSQGEEEGTRRGPDWQDRRPKNKLVQCALINATRQVYLALDVMLVNYSKVEPKEKRHYPPPTN